MNSKQKLTFLGHLKELRSSIFRMVIAFTIAVPIGYLLTDSAITILKNLTPHVQLIYTEVAEMLGAYLKVTIGIAFILSFPYFLYEIVTFINPALTRNERKYLYILLPLILCCFVLGAAFGYFVLLPPALNFLLTFGADIATPMIKVSNYINIVVNLLFWIGMCFEIPLIIYFLTKIGIIKAEWLSRYRKLAIILAFVLGAIITPTFDPVNQTLVAVPIILLYEFGIVLSKLARKKEKAAAATVT